MQGKFKITVTYTFNVEDVADYEADNLEDAARNLAEWYADGSASVAEDLSQTITDTVTVEVVS